MAARSIGSLTISFGLVAIPVKLYSATQSANAISFNLLHKGCGSRLKQQYVCLKDGSVVERDDMVKGYEFAKDQYVTFEPEEIKALEEAGTHAVEIAEFVPIESIDPVYFDKTYYLAPDKGGAKPYALLTEALKQAKRCAVGRWAARGKAYIVMLRPVGDMLTMQQLHFAADVRPASEIDVPKQDVKPAELKLAQQLIDQQTDGEVRSRRLHRRAAGAHPGRDRQEGRRPADLGFRLPAPKAAARSSTSWRRCAPASRRADAARASTAKLGPRKAPEARRGAAASRAAAKPSRKAGKR